MVVVRSIFLALLLLSGCGGSTETSGTGGAGGAAGAAGSGASGGTPSGGSSGTGASGGAGGAFECASAADCKLFADCCTCMALGPNDAPPPSCLMACDQSACAAAGVSAPVCAAGRCVAGYDCNPSAVLCNAMPPSCAAGMLPSVVAECWGPCVPATECKSVNACTDCTGPVDTCVTLDHQSGDATRHCVPIPPACVSNPTCACMAESVCPAPYSACTDFSGLPGMLCSCPNC